MVNLPSGWWRYFAASLSGSPIPNPRGSIIKIRETFVCEPLRTPVGKFGGAYREVDATFLGAAVVSGLLQRSGLPAEAVDDVLFAQGYASMEAPALGRMVALDAGLPITVAGLQLDRRCCSGLQALIYAYLQVATGA